MDKRNSRQPSSSSEKSGRTGAQCGKVDDRIARSYYRGLLTADEERSLEKHCRSCDFCTKVMASAKASWDESGQVAAGIPDAPLTAALGGVLERHFNRPSGHYPLRWAASDESPGTSGQSKGVAVAVGEDRGAVITCSAWVGARELAQGKFEIWGQQIKSLPEGVEIEEPLTYLEGKLSKGLFRICPVLKAYNLDRRLINVDIQERIIARANSLSLAIVMAILNAIRPRKEAGDVIFSAGLAPDGRLEAVGDIGRKIEAGKAAGVHRFVFPEANDNGFPDDDEIEILRFGNLQEVMLHFGILQADASVQNPEPFSMPNPCTTTGALDMSPAADLDAVVDKLQPGGHHKADLSLLLEALEDLCQTGDFQDNLSATFLFGDCEKIDKVLPPSPLSFIDGCTVFNIRGRMEAIAGLLDGDRLGMVVSPKGAIGAIRRIDLRMTGRQDVSPLLGGQRHRFALLSLLSESVLLSIPPAGNRLHIYCSGHLTARYQNGRWSTMDYDAAAETIRRLAQDAALHWETVKKILKSAISMAERELGGTFAFLAEPDAVGEWWESKLEFRFGLRLSPASVAGLTEPDIIDLAKNEGAVLIDSHGNITHCHVYFKTRLQWDGGLSERHQHAREFSRISHALVIAASRDGSVVAYFGGDVCICL